MIQSIVHIAILVKDYDEAIKFYTTKLNFILIEDIYQPEQRKRWVVISPPNTKGTTILLAKTSKPEQEKFIGNQAGGRVFLFLNTDDFFRDYNEMKLKGIDFVRAPQEADYGTVAVFKDLYGNLWDLIQYKMNNEFFYTTVILKLKAKTKMDLALSKLRTLRNQTLLESGNISFEINQVKNNPTKFILCGGFKNESYFEEHLISKHFQDFFNNNLFELEEGYITKNIE